MLLPATAGEEPLPAMCWCTWAPNTATPNIPNHGWRMYPSHRGVPLRWQAGPKAGMPVDQSSHLRPNRNVAGLTMLEGARTSRNAISSMTARTRKPNRIINRCPGR
jgi:hypothetical protein